MKKVRVNDRFIPEEVVRDILVRVSIKTCFACKLVCKAWYNMIMDPNFSTDFRRFRFTSLYYCPRPPKGKSYKYEKPTNYSVLVDLKMPLSISEKGYIKIDNIIYKSINFGFLPNEVQVSNVCNGAICYRKVRHNEYYIRNLTTNQNVTVKGPKWWYYEEVFWLGFSSVSLRFKLLRVFDEHGEYDKGEIKTVGVDEEWRSIGVAPKGLKIMGQNSSFVNDCLYWYPSKTIWSFNFEKEVFLQVPLPDKFGTNDCRYVIYLTAYNSTLCLCDAYYIRKWPNYFCEIWVMKEYGVKDSWVKQHVIPTGYHDESIIYVPLMEMDSGEVLMKMVKDDDRPVALELAKSPLSQN